jgi:ABC-type polysaccharide/polyol phosphate export permease
MQQSTAKTSMFWSAMTILELIYHSAVRDIRKKHRNAMIGLLLNIVQMLVFIGGFFAMFWILGARTSPVRGDFLLYIMTGIFLFMAHSKAMGAVFSAEGPTSPMMQHAPLNTVVTISGAALAALYTQMLSLAVILYVYHIIGNPVIIADPAKAFAMLMVAFVSGMAIGLMFVALKPWFPNFTTIAQSVYSRANMIFSGKMFLAGTMPAALRPWFEWNPLFHCIDQTRLAVFKDYTLNTTSVTYPIYITLGLVCLGMMAEFFTRKQASASWGALQ